MQKLESTLFFFFDNFSIDIIYIKILFLKFHKTNHKKQLAILIQYVFSLFISQQRDDQHSSLVLYLRLSKVYYGCTNIWPLDIKHVYHQQFKVSAHVDTCVATLIIPDNLFLLKTPVYLLFIFYFQSHFHSVSFLTTYITYLY